MADVGIVLDDLIGQAVTDVLETMFFTAVDGPAEEPCSGGQCLAVRVVFDGHPPGVFQLSVACETARRVAESFLGVESEDELDEAQVENVARELANVLCGAVLSRLEAKTTFSLGPPELVDPPVPLGGGGVVERRFQLENGSLTVALSLAG